jgi:hypothetical protein
LSITSPRRAESITAAGGSGGVKAARPGAGAFRRRRLAGPDLGARHHPSLMAPAPEDASSPSSATLTDRHWRYTWRMAAGVLVVVLATLASDPELRVVRETRYATGSGVKLVQVWRGLDVLGRGAFVRLDAAGRPRWQVATKAFVPDDLGAPLPVEEILARLGRAELPAERHARLVVWAPPGRAPRLAYEVVLPRDLERLQTLRLVVDARSGALVWAQDLVLRARQAQVFPTNPDTSELTTVTLELPDGATTLTSAELEVVNCLDEGTCPLLRGETRTRWCETVAAAVADGAGDFLYARPADDADREDAFSEVQLFHHGTRALAYFRDLGFAGLDARPLLAVANLRMPDLSRATCDGVMSDLPLEPYENALFMPAGAIARVFPPGDAIVFGQGATIDYAYDGDVVTHEITHAVAATLTSMGSVTVDAHGLDGSMGAMHEGFADYFAAVLGDGPEIAEYVGARLEGRDGALRTLANQRRCPENLDGEEHDDSAIFSGALWELRTRLAAEDERVLDRAVFTVLDSLADEESFDSVRLKLEAEVAMLLGEGLAGTARAIFAARGLDGCDGRVHELPLGVARQRMHVVGARAFGLSQPLPGPLQLRVLLLRPAREIHLSIARSSSAQRGGEGEPQLQLLVKAGEPIRWDEDALTHDAPHAAAVEIDAGGQRAGRAVVSGDFPAGVYHVQLTNAGTSWWLGGLIVRTDGEDGEADEGGCAVGGGGGGLLGLVWLAIFARGIVPRPWSGRRRTSRCRRTRDRDPRGRG